MPRRRTSHSESSKWIIGGIAALGLVAATGATAYFAARESMQPDNRAVAAAPQGAQMARIAPASGPVRPAAPPCDDKNILGTVGGAVAGGVVGNQFGGGSGKTIATVGGAVAGGYLGNEYLPTRNATCR